MCLTNWDCLSDSRKKNEAARFYDLLFADPCQLTADIYGHQRSIKALKVKSMGKLDDYFTPNPVLKNKGRSKDAVKYINCIKLDLDSGVTDRFKGNPLSALCHMLEFIPYNLLPSAVVNSGNGLHCYWPLDKGMSKIGGCNLHSKIVEKLCDLYRDYNPDRAASKDIARVLRTIGSINGKHGKEVQLLYLVEKKHTVDELATAVLGPDWDGSQSPATAKQLNYIAIIERFCSVYMLFLQGNML